MVGRGGVHHGDPGRSRLELTTVVDVQRRRNREVDKAVNPRRGLLACGGFQGVSESCCAERHYALMADNQMRNADVEVSGALCKCDLREAA